MISNSDVLDLHFGGLGTLVAALGLHFGDLGYLLVSFGTIAECLECHYVLHGIPTTAGALFCCKPWPEVEDQALRCWANPNVK